MPAVYVRHGKTGLNLGGSEERLRGWLPVPLTPEGVQQGIHAGMQLQGTKFDSFSTSDLYRAHQMANLIGSAIGMAPTPDPELRDWNTGDLAGQKFDDVKPIIEDLLKNPDKAAPNGESIHSYLARFVPAMRKRIEDPKHLHLVVGHARGAMVLKGIASPVGGVGQDLNKAFLMKRPDVEPGESLIIQPNWNIRELSMPPALREATKE